MAEPRRISLISCPAVPVAAAPTKIPAEPESMTFTAVEFDVIQPTDTLGPAYDFEKLLEEQKKNDTEETPKTDDPFGEEEEEAKAVKLAKHFEEKYGSSGPRGLKELGAGYDHNDPFVDDGQSGEATIPLGWTTQHGGFYISTGPLYVRPLREEEEKSNVYQSASAEECIAAVKQLAGLALKRKRVVESSEEDSEDESVIKRKKKALERPSSASAKIDPVMTKKAVAGPPKTVASMLAAANNRKDPFVTSSEDETEPAVEDAPTDLRIPKESAPVAAVEAVVVKPAVKKSSEKMETAAARSDSGDGSAPVLPDEVPDSVRKVVDEIKALADSWDGGKCNFFNAEHNPAINVLLLRLEYECRQFRCGLRSSIFGHVAGCLPCTKETLVKRARKLRQDDVDGKFSNLVAKLVNAIHNDAGGGVDPVSRSLKTSMKKLMVEGVRLKMSVYDLHKQRFATHEDYMKNFVDTELVPLWKNRAIEKETIYSEALMALGVALRPPSHTTSKSSKSTASKGDLNMPPAIAAPVTVRIPAAHQGKITSHSTSMSSGGRPPTDIMSVARLNSGAKVQHTSKNELRKENGSSSSRQPSSSGSIRKPIAEVATKPSSSSSVEPKPVFLPDVNGRSVIKADPLSHPPKKSGDHHRRESSSSHHDHSRKHKPSSLEAMERPSVSSRSGRPSEKPARYRSEASQQQEAELKAARRRQSSGGSSSHKSGGDRHSSDSPKVVNAVGERPSSSSSAGSGKPSKSSGGGGGGGGGGGRSKNLPRPTAVEFGESNYSVASLGSPFVPQFSLPLSAGFSPENLFGMTLPNAGNYMYPDGALAAFMSTMTGAYGANGSSFPRASSGSSLPKVTPASQTDSPFAPR
ncbi:hypothetical protein BV898_05925 [Hypsibius exemplaris]|uniref:Ubinuclein-1 n=1 Tax=Hypsibius exemplaris TaxID=2072580 RepID=A0A1W0WY75_HYPEX|nr:hypothetical protein BV898_05925 [Hypsibius exemplaris]